MLSFFVNVVAFRLLTVFVIIFLFTGAVRRNRILKRATRAEVETTVKLWLRYSYDRGGGRAARTPSGGHQARPAADTDVESD